MTLPKRVLAIRLDTIGDVIMSTPALGAMADAGSQITLLTSSISAPLEPMLPYLHDIVTLDVPWMKPAERHLVPAAQHMKTIEHLKAQRYDLAVVFTVSTQDPSCAAYLAYMAGIPRVAAHAHRKLYGLLTDPVPDPSGPADIRHEVVRQLELVSSLGFQVNRRSLRLHIPAPTRRVRAVLEQVAGGPWAVVHPGASAPSRRYPVEQWSRVVDLLHENGVRVVLSGGRGDGPRCSAISRGSHRPPLRTDGQFTLSESASLMEAASVAVTCNSAAAHIAAAAGTPLITVYAGTNAQHEPWSENATVLRHPTSCAWCLSSACKHGTPLCTSAINPSTVAEAALKRLARESLDATADEHVVALGM